MNAERPTARLQTKNQQRPPSYRKRYLAMRLSFLFFAVLIVFAIGCGRVENMESKQKAFERLKDERSKFEPGYPARCLEFATANEGCEVGIDALFWVTSCNRNTVGFQDVNDLALERLVTKYLDHPKTQSAVFQMHKQRSPKTIEHLEMLLNCDNETIRGLAMFSLGVRIKAKDKVRALSLLEKVVQNHPGLTVSRSSGTEVDVHALAEQYIFDFSKLEYGMLAPPTQGIDLNGDELSLAEYRGKVILLSFWADW